MGNESREEAPDEYTVSIILWGGEKPGEDPTGHVAVAVHRSTAQPTTCHLHHARCPDQVRFIYESRPEQDFNADPAPRGRCNLRSDLSAEDVHAANTVLARFGADESQLPYFGEGNCHNWAAGAVAALEEAGLAAPRDGARWAAMIGKGPLAIETSWSKDAGRHWVPCEKFNQVRPGAVDAKWGVEINATGELKNTHDFRDRVKQLQNLLHHRQG
ncbi:hypothetical protein GGS26DRAFT_596706 [Hypomontagnella submonticulosa]|nr:hypothetical protein GGS26DRAFT_596706 [Hypomontagnella submonticulosa]